jgi:hypothetical protein
MAAIKERGLHSINETVRTVSEKLATVLSGKPIWASWIAYTVLSGIVLAVLYALTFLLAFRWWGAAAAVIAIGMLWGTVARSTISLRKKGESQPGLARMPLESFHADRFPESGVTRGIWHTSSEGLDSGGVERRRSRTGNSVG